MLIYHLYNNHHNKPNNHAMLFFKWQSFPNTTPNRIKVPISQGVIRVNVPFRYNHHNNPNNHAMLCFKDVLHR